MNYFKKYHLTFGAVTSDSFCAKSRFVTQTVLEET